MNRYAIDSFLLLLAFLLFSLSTVVADSCAVAYSNGGYDIRQCYSVPSQQVQTNPTAILTGDDDVTVQVNLPFNIHLYGTIFDRVWISSNGLLNFGLSGYAYAYASLPLAYNDDDYLPLFAPFWTDLADVNRGNITHSTEGTSPNRQFVLRFKNVDYWISEANGLDLAVTFDVIFYENSPNNVEVRYYRIDVPSDAEVVIGIESDDYESWTSFYNYVQVTSSLANSLVNTTLKFIYTSVDATNATCGGLGYNFDPLRTIDLSYNDTTNRYVYYFRPCGIVTATPCLQSASTEHSMICQAAYSIGGTFNSYDYSLAVYNPNAVYWQFLDNQQGVVMMTEDGQVCGSYPRISVTRFQCDLTATTPKFVYFQESPQCTYNLYINTTLACTNGIRNTPYADPNYNVNSTLTSCLAYSGSYYNARLCPNTMSGFHRNQQILTNPVPILINQDDNFVTIHFNESDGFVYSLYGVNHQYVSVTSNGVLGFGYYIWYGTPGTNFPGLGFGTDDDIWPSIFPFFADLINYRNEQIPPFRGNITYSWERAPSGAKQLIIRFNRVDYYWWSFFVAEATVSFDIVLTSGTPGGIEIRYYKLDPAPNQNVIIGIHGLESEYSYTQVLGLQPFTSKLASMFSGTTLTYAYTGATKDVACGYTAPSGYPSYDLTSISSQDLNWNKSDGTQYWFRPCGIVQNRQCQSWSLSWASTACQISGGTPYGLAEADPNGISYTAGPNWLKSTSTEGNYCGAVSAQRTLIVQYYCSPTATTPIFWKVEEDPICTYTFYINTTVVCAPPVNCTIVASDMDYNITSCNYVPPRRALSYPQQILINQDDNAIRLTSPFDIHLYGSVWKHFWVSSNGVINFGPSILATTPTTLPLSLSSFYDTLPAFFPLWIDMETGNGGNITWSTEGVAPYRYLYIRFENVSYWSTFTEIKPASMTFDVVFAETSMNTVSLRIYKLDVGDTYNYMTIGIQSEELYFTSFLNYQQITSSLASSLVGSTLNWIYTGVDVSTQRVCGGLGYNFTSLTQSDLLYDETSRRYLYVFRPCSIVNNSVCLNSPYTERSSICQLPYSYDSSGNAILSSGYSLGVYDPNAITWYYQSNGVIMIYEDGEWCAAATIPRITEVLWQCDPTVTAAKFVAFSERSTCVYVLTINTTLACGGGNRVADGWTPSSMMDNTNVRSTLTNCIPYTGAFYSASLCPNPIGTSPQAQTSPTSILVGSSNGYATITLPSDFNLYIYGTQYSHLSIGVNGMIEFGYYQTSDEIPGAFPSNGLTTDNWPFIAALWTNLQNGLSGATTGTGVYNGSITLSYETITNSDSTVTKQLVIRYQNVLYPDAPLIVTATFDVIITSGNPSTVAVRYFRINPFPYQTVVIGMHGDTSLNDYISVINNQQITTSLSHLISGTTITYTYTGKNPSSECVFILNGATYNLSSITTDLIYYGSLYTYYYSPCRPIQATVCSSNIYTMNAQACQIPVGYLSGWALATINPNAISYNLSYANDGTQIITAITTDGMYCSVVNVNNPRTVQVKYYCVPTATTPNFWFVKEDPTCTYTFNINTSLACPPSSSSSASVSPRSSSSSASIPPTSSSSSASASVSSSTGASSSLVPSFSSSSSSSSGSGNPVDNGGSSSSLSSGQIAGIVVGCVIGGVLILSICICCCCTGCFAAMLGKKKNHSYPNNENELPRSVQYSYDTQTDQSQIADSTIDDHHEETADGEGVEMSQM